MIAEAGSLSKWIVDHWAMLAILGTLLFLVTASVWILAYYVRICLKIFCDTPPPMSMNPVDFSRIEGETVRFRSFDGTSLQGMRIRVPETVKYKGTIVFCHEFGADMYSFARYARHLLAGGYDIFTFDFRGHGKSSGSDYQPLQWPSDRELSDAIGACAYIQSILLSEGKNDEIGIFGISRGAGAAILTAGSDSRIKAIVCDGAFSTEDTLIALMKRWAYIFASLKLTYQNNPDAYWKGLLWLMMRFAQPKLKRRFPSVRKTLRDMESRPVYFIHGKRDSYIRLEETIKLHNAAPSPRHLWIVSKAKHNQAVIIEPESYASRTLAFFDKHLAGLDIQDHIISPDTEKP